MNNLSKLDFSSLNIFRNGIFLHKIAFFWKAIDKRESLWYNTKVKRYNKAFDVRKYVGVAQLVRALA